MIKPGEHCTYVRYEAATKAKPAGYVSYPATALTEPNTEGKIQLSFYHESGQRHLGGADWADAFLRADDVAPEDGHGEFVSFWRALGNSLPSEDDLDVVAEEEEAKEQTAGGRPRIIKGSRK